MMYITGKKDHTINKIPFPCQDTTNQHDIEGGGERMHRALDSSGKAPPSRAMRPKASSTQAINSYNEN